MNLYFDVHVFELSYFWFFLWRLTHFWTTFCAPNCTKRMRTATRLAKLLLSPFVCVCVYVYFFILQNNIKKIQWWNTTNKFPRTRSDQSFGWESSQPTHTFSFCLCVRMCVSAFIQVHFQNTRLRNHLIAWNLMRFPQSIS